MSRQFKHLPVALPLIVLAFFAFDSVVSTTMLSSLVPLHDREMTFLAFGSFAGLLAGQALLAATWLALGAGPLSIRLPGSLGIFALVLFSWFVGASLSQMLPSMLDALLTAAMCLVLFISVMAPLWIARLVTQRRIIAWDSPRETESREQFSLRYAFIATACVAFLLTLSKLIFGDTPWGGNMDARWSIMVALLIFVLAFGAYISLVALPLLWIILREPRGTMISVTILTGAMVLCPIVVSEALFAIPGLGRPPARLYPWIIGALLTYGFTVALVTAAGFLVARFIGLRFVSSEFRRSNPL